MRIGIAALMLLLLLAPGGLSQDSDRVWAERVLKSMTLREKIAQLIQVRVQGKFINRHNPEYLAIRDLIQNHHVGGIVLFAGYVYESAILINDLQKVSRLPLLVSADFERGVSFRIADTTSFPWNMALGATGSEEFAFRQGVITARESRALGVHWIYAPVVDINSNPENPVINIRSYGEDPELVARLASAFIRGARQGEVLTTAKHFPGHGDTSTDSHLGLPVLQSDLNRLQSVEFLPFRTAIEAGVDSIMTAHVALPQVTGDQEGPATLSRKILTEMLRTSLKFNGLVVTDALEMAGITQRFWCGLAAVRAIQAGADVLLLPPDAVIAVNEVERAVRRGDISESRIDESARRILLAKQRLGLHRRRLVPIEPIGELVAMPESIKLAQDIADRSITVVRDEQRLLPLNPAAGSRLFSLVLSSDLESSPASIFQAEMRRRFPFVRTAWANARVPADLLETIDRAISQADLIVCATVVRLTSGPDSTEMAQSHRGIIRKLLNSGKPVIWVSFGNPYLLRSLPQAPTYVCAFSYADVSQRAAVKAIAGEIPVEGRMPVSIPGHCRAGDGLRIPRLEMTLNEQASGIAETAFAKTRQALDTSVKKGLFNAAEIWVARKNRVVLKHAAGAAPGGIYSPPFLADLEIALGVMLASESGNFIAEAPVSDYIPEYKGKEADLRVNELWSPVSKRADAQTAEALSRRRLLMEIIARTSGLPFRRFLTQRLFRPLGIGMGIADPTPLREMVARTTVAAKEEPSCRARDLAVLAQMLLNHGIYDHRRFLKADTIAWFTGSQGPWSKPSDADWTGRRLSPSAFGYSSSNGSLVWINPAEQIFVILLCHTPISLSEDDRIAAQNEITSAALSELAVSD